MVLLVTSNPFGFIVTAVHDDIDASSYLLKPSTRARYDTRSVFFKAEFNRFEFRVFLLLD